MRHLGEFAREQAGDQDAFEVGAHSVLRGGPVYFGDSRPERCLRAKLLFPAEHAAAAVGGNMAPERVV
jgi:hypothetical protein